MSNYLKQSFPDAHVQAAPAREPNLNFVADELVRITDQLSAHRNALSEVADALRGPRPPTTAPIGTTAGNEILLGVVGGLVTNVRRLDNLLNDLEVERTRIWGAI